MTRERERWSSIKMRIHPPQTRFSLPSYAVQELKDEFERRKEMEVSDEETSR